MLFTDPFEQAPGCAAHVRNVTWTEEVVCIGEVCRMPHPFYHLHKTSLDVKRNCPHDSIEGVINVRES